MNRPQSNQNKYLCIYSSVGGNTEMVMQVIEQIFNQNNLQLNLIRAEQVKDFQALIQNTKLLILACPTYKQGSLEDYFEKFMKTLSGFQPSLIQDRPVAIVGLGDNRYYPEYLTESASIIESQVIKLGGVLFCPSLRVGMPPIKYLDSLVKNWATKLITKITDQKL